MFNTRISIEIKFNLNEKSTAFIKWLFSVWPTLSFSSTLEIDSNTDWQTVLVEDIGIVQLVSIANELKQILGEEYTAHVENLSSAELEEMGLNV